VVLSQKEKFREISSLGEKNKVAKNQTKHYFGKKKTQNCHMLRKKKM